MVGRESAMDSTLSFSKLQVLLVAGWQQVPAEALIWLGLLLVGLLPALLRARPGRRGAPHHLAEPPRDGSAAADTAQAAMPRRDHARARAIVAAHLAARREASVCPDRVQRRVERSAVRSARSVARTHRRY